MARPFLSIISLNWNRKDDIRDLLGRLKRLRTPGMEVIVVDNASTDGSPGLIRREFPWVRLVRLAVNQGIPAYNAGLAAARGEWLMVIDNDVIPADAGLFRRFRAIAESTKADVLCCRILDREGRRAWDDPRYLPGGSGREGYPAFAFNGCGAFLRRALYRRIGGFDPRYFIYYCEMDWCVRAMAAGASIRYYPGLAVLHKARDPGTRSRMRAYYRIRNMLVFHAKFAPFPSLLGGLLLFLGAAVRDALAVRSLRPLAGYLAGLGMLPEVFRNARTPVPAVWSLRQRFRDAR
jgi:hypothetical protein